MSTRVTAAAGVPRLQQAFLDLYDGEAPVALGRTEAAARMASRRAARKLQAHLER